MKTQYEVLVTIKFGQIVEATSEEEVREIIKEQYYEAYGIKLVGGEISIEDEYILAEIEEHE